jgi:toxin ParE1/3/4
VTARHLVRGVRGQIDRIFDYIARDDPDAAQRVVDRIHKVIDLVTERPRIGRKTFERGVRMYVVKPYPYIVFDRYQPREGQVRIIRVRHGAQRWAGLADEAQQFRRVAIS